MDPAALDELAAGLHRVATTIEGLQRLGVGSVDTGSVVVSGALGAAGRDWSHARRRIGQELAALSRAADLAARAYRQADQDVAGACRP